MTSVLITGITGFIGSHLGKELVEKGYSVYGLVRHCSSRDLRPIKEISDKIVLMTGDLGDYPSIHNALRASSPDIICHLAALTPVRYSFEHPFQYERDNYLGTMNLSHAVLDLPDPKKRRILAASTAEVYGIQEKNQPFLEDLPLKPSSPYAVSKAAAEMYLRMASSVYGLNCTILRPVNSYGRKYETGFIMEYLVTSSLRGEKTYIGAPESVRDYLYVDDHVSAYLTAIEKDLSDEVFNVSSGLGISNRELAQRIAKTTGNETKNTVFGSYPPGYPLRPLASDQPYLVLDSSKLRQRGWRPKVTLDGGLKKVIDYWKPLITQA